MKEIGSDEVIVYFVCDDCGYWEYVSLTRILDGDSLECDCGTNMTPLMIILTEE
jgi:hypothetical protein